MQMPPGSAILSSRAAMLTPSPKMSWGSTITSPILMPTRKVMRLSSTSPIVSSSIRVWNCTAAGRLRRRSKTPPTTRRRCSSRCGRRGRQSLALHRSLGEWPVWRGSPLRHYASTASSQPRRRPRSPTASARTRSGRSCTMPAIQPRRDLYNGSLGMAIRANVAIGSFAMGASRQQTPLCRRSGSKQA